MVTESRARGARALEPTVQAELSYVREIRSLARIGQRFYQECTPGYYNSEGAAGNRHGFFSDMYGAGPLAFFEKLEAWRANGLMEGIELS
jgi:cyclohexanone monooxygenase